MRLLGDVRYQWRAALQAVHDSEHAPTKKARVKAQRDLTSLVRTLSRRTGHDYNAVMDSVLSSALEESVMQIRLGDLKYWLREELLHEAGDDDTADDDLMSDPTQDPTAAEQEPNDSLDDQVDRYLSQYQEEAKGSKTEGLDFRTMCRNFLTEAGDDDTTNAAGGDPTDDAATGAPAPAPAKLGLDSIDVDSFANSVVRLIQNYDSLLEVRSTLTRRAHNFLAKSYSPDVVEAYDKSMREDHGIVPGESKSDVDADEFPAPPAARAGEGGEGGAPA